VAKRKRNYALEYRRRLERAKLRGLSKTQARGHPRSGENPLSTTKRVRLQDAKIQQGLRALRKGTPLNAAAHSAGLSSERLRKYLVDKKIGSKRGKKWKLVERNLAWEWIFISEGQLVSVVVGSLKYSTLIARYLNAVKQFLHTNDPKILKPFENVTVRNIKGQKYIFETRPRLLYRIMHPSYRSYLEHYKIVAKES
jgi:hypothetical protein